MAPRRVVLGNVHQGCAQFAPYNGVQCTAIAFVALLTFCMHYTPVNEWEASNVDSVLWEGTFLYQSVLPHVTSGNTPHPYLSHTDLPATVPGFPLEANLNHQGFIGVVSDSNGNSNQNEHFGFLTLQHAMELGFGNSPYLLFTAGGFTIAIFHCTITDTFYVFDSHCRNGNGLPCTEGSGAAVLMQFDCILLLQEYLQMVYTSQQFEITPVFLSQVLGSDNEEAVTEDLSDGNQLVVNQTLFHPDESSGNIMLSGMLTKNSNHSYSAKSSRDFSSDGPSQNSVDVDHCYIKRNQQMSDNSSISSNRNRQRFVPCAKNAALTSWIGGW